MCPLRWQHYQSLVWVNRSHSSKMINAWKKKKKSQIHWTSNTGVSIFARICQQPHMLDCDIYTTEVLFRHITIMNNLCSLVLYLFPLLLLLFRFVAVNIGICREDVIFSESNTRSLQVPRRYSGGGTNPPTHRAHHVFLSSINTCPQGRKFNELLVFFWLPITSPLCVVSLVHANTTPDVNLHFFFFFFLLITMEDYNGLFGRKASPTKFWVSVNVMPTPTTTSTWINPIKPSLISWIAFWELITAVVEF